MKKTMRMSNISLDGMTETLIKTLSGLPGLVVKPRSSVFRYKSKETDLQTVREAPSVQRF